MPHIVNGVVWKSRLERLWGHILLEYTEAQIRLLDRLEKR